MTIHTIKIIIAYIIGSLLILWSNIALAEMLIYQVHIDRNNPYQAKILIDTSSLGNFELLPARNMIQNKKTEPMIICDQQKGLRADKPLALQCNQISWEVSFKAFAPKGEDISQQNNLFISHPEPLWILTEWDTLPRLKNHDQVLVCMNDSKLSRCQPLPTEQQPPLIMAFGSPKAQYKLANLEVHLFGDIDTQQEQDLLKKYDEIIAYLTSIFPNDLDKKKWDLIWLPIEKSSGLVGGAAGNNSFMANYPVENGQWTKESEEWLLKISAHEAVHVITRLDNPLWVEESLAEYYAFKACNILGIITTNPLQSFLESKATIPHSTSSLYYAEQRLAKPHEDMSFYPLLYRKGSAFWYEVDMALQNKGGNLDDYIKQLDGLTFDEGKLPEKFEIALQMGMSAPVWKIIKQKYLLD